MNAEQAIVYNDVFFLIHLRAVCDACQDLALWLIWANTWSGIRFRWLIAKFIRTRERG